MKGYLFAICLAFLRIKACAQGLIAFDNTANGNTSLTATSGGLFFIQCHGTWVPINEDFNVALYGGTDSSSLPLIISISGSAAIGDNFAGPGTFVDPSGATYAVPGTTTASTSAFFRLEAWLGPYSSFIAALNAGSPAGISGVFSNPVAALPNLPPDLVGMPAVLIGFDCPEPGTLGLAALGGLWVWSVHRRKGPRTEGTGTNRPVSVQHKSWPGIGAERKPI